MFAKCHMAKFSLHHRHLSSKASKWTEGKTWNWPASELLLFDKLWTQAATYNSVSIPFIGIRLQVVWKRVVLRLYWSAHCQHCSMTSHWVCRWSLLQLLLADCAICELKSCAISGAATGQSGLTALWGKAATDHLYLAGWMKMKHREKQQTLAVVDGPKTSWR